MRRKIIVLVLGLLLLPWASLTIAADLPIDIGAIGEMEREDREAVTVRFGADLFSESAEDVNAILAEQLRLSRAVAALGLFLRPTGEPLPDMEEQVIRAADDAVLFASPMQFGRAGPAVEEAAEIPTWVFIVVLAFCAVGGFLLARTMMQRRERDSDVSHVDN